MHQIYLAMATDIARDRIREAADWRRADEGRTKTAPAGLVGRLRARLAGLAGIARRPLLTAAYSPDASERS